MSRRIILTRAKSARAAEPDEIRIRTGLSSNRVIIRRDSASALALAKEKARAQDLILVTGSLYLAGEILRETGFTEKDGLF